jgi:hypothetical protein
LTAATHVSKTVHSLQHVLLATQATVTVAQEFQVAQVETQLVETAALVTMYLAARALTEHLHVKPQAVVSTKTS